MRKTSLPRKVILLADTPSGATSEKKKAASRLLPAIKFVESSKNDDGLFKLPDGGYRRIIEVEGINLIDFCERPQSLDRTLQNLVTALTCDMQLIVTSRPFALQSIDAYKEKQGRPDDEYLAWYSDYTSKWFTRVAELHYLPEKRYFIVVSLPATKAKKPHQGKSQKAIQERAHKAFDRAFIHCLDELKNIGQKPRLLGRREIRNLLMQSFLLPREGSGVNPMVEFAECIAPSTLMEPFYEETRSYLKMGDFFQGAGAVAHMPASVGPGWLANIVFANVPYTISVHLRRCNQKAIKAKIGTIQRSGAGSKTTERQLAAIADGSEKAIDVSITFSSYSKWEEQLQDNLKKIRDILNVCGAVVSMAPDKQRLTWCSTLPLGLELTKVAQKISSGIAGTCWPLIGSEPFPTYGLPLGFSTESLAPIFIDPQETNKYLVTGSEKKDREALAGFIAMRHLEADFRVCYIGASRAANFIATLLGPKASSKVMEGKDEPVHNSKDDADTASNYILAKCADALTRSQLVRLKKVLEQVEQSKKKVAIIENAAIFLKDDQSKTALKNMIEQAEKKTISYISFCRARESGRAENT